MLLESERDQKVLPVFIAPGEAQSILMRLKGVESRRPLTHDLLLRFLGAFDAEVKRVVINALDEDTDIFYATILYAVDGKIMDMDARPSDAVAIALRCDAPIWVDDSVMTKAAVPAEKIQVVETDDDDMDTQEIAVSRPVTEDDVITSLEDRLQRAIDEERYEDAAHLRDQIEDLKHTSEK
jgi:bifunctional DNase/RNase